MQNLINIESEKHFEEIIALDEFSIMMFSAPWCIDCRNINVYLHETIEEFSNQAKFYYVDYDKFNNIFQQYNISGIPNFLIFKNLEVVGQIGNGRSIDQDDLEDYIEQVLNFKPV